MTLISQKPGVVAAGTEQGSMERSACPGSALRAWRPRRLAAVVYAAAAVFAALLAIATRPVAAAVTDFDDGRSFEGFEADLGDWAHATPFEAVREASGNNGIDAAAGDFYASAAAGEAPYTTWGGYNYGAGNAVPTAFVPYTTEVRVFLDVDGGWANDTRFDFSSAINTSAGVHRRDFVFNAGFYDDNDASPGAGSDRFIFSASNNAGRSNAYPKNPGRSPVAVTVTGWYALRHRFSDVGGVLVVDLELVAPDGSLAGVWTLSDPGDTIGLIGGNRYGWIAANEFAVLAFDNALLSTGLPHGLSINQQEDDNAPNGTHVYGSTWTVVDEWADGRLTIPSLADYDEEVTDEGNGNGVWRMSNAVTSGGMSDQPNSPSAPLVAGETGAELWNDRGPNHTTPVNPPYARATAATPFFSAAFSFKSVTGSPQADLPVHLAHELPVNHRHRCRVRPRLLRYGQHRGFHLDSGGDRPVVRRLARHRDARRVRRRRRGRRLGQRCGADLRGWCARAHRNDVGDVLPDARFAGGIPDPGGRRVDVPVLGYGTARQPRPGPVLRRCRDRQRLFRR
jgi:hypothetical protein